MKKRIQTFLEEALQTAYDSGDLPSDEFPPLEIEIPKSETHGDYATNLAMNMAKTQRMAPRKIADILVRHIPPHKDVIEKIEIAGPGFINFYLKKTVWGAILKIIHDQADQYGANNLGKGRRVQVEFVSANPTGPLHVGHGRGAAVGDSIARILTFSGYDVSKEYYINDSGRQIRTLGLSVFLRLKESCGETVDFPDSCYKGEYIRDIAQKIKNEADIEPFLKDEDQGIFYCSRYAAAFILKGIQQDLKNFNVVHDNWFSEQSLYDEDKVFSVIRDLEKKEIVFDKDGAKWFNATRYGDEKDRVVITSEGRTTYFASDIAYHQHKFERGFDWCIDVWGADHHGYIPRMSAAVEALGYQRNQFDVVLVKLVNLLRDGQPVAMSTRAGEFITLEEVVKEVGTDAARFIFLSRSYESPLDFDLNLAQQKNSDNPVYYVQYVHARICSIAEKAQEGGFEAPKWHDSLADRLVTTEEIQLIKLMAHYPETVLLSVAQRAPHRITFFLMALAAAFHTFYNKHRVIGEVREMTQARLCLISAVKQVIFNGLFLLGVSAPESM